MQRNFCFGLRQEQLTAPPISHFAPFYLDGLQILRIQLPLLCRCEGEVIVQGDEGPVRGVAQVVECHGVTVSHQEREEVEERQEVESDGEKNTQGTLRMSMDGMTMKDKCERL